MNLYYESNSLQHHGIKGMRWGVRRFQKKDGSLTPAGEKRYSPKTIAEKKEIESFKAQRSARRLGALGELHRMVLNSRNTPNIRKQSEGQLDLERQKVRKAAKEAAAANRLEKQKLKSENDLARQKLKLEKDAQKQAAKDRAADRDLEKRKLKQEADESNKQYKLEKKKLGIDREEVRLQNSPDSDGYYELPDSYDRQRSSAGTGKKLATAALAVAGTAALAVAAKKYGPSILSKLRDMKAGEKVGKAVDTANKAADTADIAMKVFREASKYHNQQALPSGPSTPLLSAPSSGSDTSGRSSSNPSPGSVSSVMNTIGDIPLYLGS